MLVDQRKHSKAVKQDRSVKTLGSSDQGEPQQVAALCAVCIKSIGLRNHAVCIAHALRFANGLSKAGAQSSVPWTLCMHYLGCTSILFALLHLQVLWCLTKNLETNQSKRN
jgi:hypothetical protein